MRYYKLCVLFLYFRKLIPPLSFSLPRRSLLLYLLIAQNMSLYSIKLHPRVHISTVIAWNLHNWAVQSSRRKHLRLAAVIRILSQIIMCGNDKPITMHLIQCKRVWKQNKQKIAPPSSENKCKSIVVVSFYVYSCNISVFYEEFWRNFNR